MEGIYWVHLMVLLCFGMFVGTLCQDDSDDSATTAVYIVTLKQASVTHYYGELRKETNVFKHGGPSRPNKLHKPRCKIIASFDASFISVIALLLAS